MKTEEEHVFITPGGGGDFFGGKRTCKVALYVLWAEEVYSGVL